MTVNRDHTTKRSTVPNLEKLLFKELPILDHGFLRVVDYMGDDAAIVQAARVSYGAGTKAVREDRSLVRYLMKNHHTSPFEMCEIKFHVKLPIFVARQWIRHRTANVNEYSARYSILDKEFYFPAPHNLSGQSETNRQGRGEPVTPEVAQHVLRIMREDAQRNYDHYLEFLAEDKEVDGSRPGIARELARMNLTLNTYTQWYWKIDLHNLFGFVQLRADQHAQFEIREYANRIIDVLKVWVPSAYEAFEEYRLHAVTLSKTEIAILRDLLSGKDVSESRAALSNREWDSLAKVFNLKAK